MSEYLLETRNLVKSFVAKSGLFGFAKQYHHAVNGIDFTVSEGESFGIVGESGCGKSTTARMIAGIETVTSGDILFQGKSTNDWFKTDPVNYRRNVQMVFQNPAGSLNPRLRIGEAWNLQLKRLTDLSPSERAERIAEITDRVRLEESALKRYPHEFSGGQAQRVCIARALLARPKMLILDEPVSALDVSIQAQILHLLHEMRETLNLTYVFISHDLAVVEELCSRVMVIFAGKIVERGETSNLFKNRKHPYTDLLLRSVPVPNQPFSLRSNIPAEEIPKKGCPFRARCPRASERCEQSPSFETIGGKSEHAYACHHPLETDS